MCDPLAFLMTDQVQWGREFPTNTLSFGVIAHNSESAPWPLK
jgi:hypothetical protein